MSIAKQRLLESTLLNSDTNTASIRLRWIEHAAVQVIISAVTGPTASVKLQASNDATNWNDLSGTSNSITSTGNFVISQANIGYKHLRAAFTVSAGDITAEVIVTGREKAHG